MKRTYSFIVPVYNAEKFLTQCIESILSQTYTSFELILVDDGSLDESGRICDSYIGRDSRVVVIHQENLGVVTARINGMLRAKGEYICCVDADDYVENDYIEQIDNCVTNFDVDIVCTSYYDAEDDKTTVKHHKVRDGYFSRNNIINEIFPVLLASTSGTYFSPTVWGKAIKLELFKEYQMKVDPRIKMGEDGACIIPCIYSASSIYILNEPLYYYRMNLASVTRNHTVLDFEQLLITYSVLCKSVDLEEFDFTDQMNRRITKSFFNVAKSRFYLNKRYSIIKLEIINQMRNPVYKKAIENANFKGSIKSELISVLLKNKLVFPIYMLSRLEIVMR